MPYAVTHEYLDGEPRVYVDADEDLATVRCIMSGELPIRFPGKLITYTRATYRHGTYDEDKGLWVWQTKKIPLTLVIKTPDGLPFTADHVTLNDLRKFRDLRGPRSLEFHPLWA
jgi:hypothetical protein